MTDILKQMRETKRRIGQTETDERQYISTAGAQVPRSSGGPLFAIDVTNEGSALPIGNNGTATPFGNARDFSGLIIISETAVVGSAAVFLVDGAGAVILVAQTAANYTVVAGTAASTNVYTNATPAVEIENKLGGTASYNIMALRTRNV